MILKWQLYPWTHKEMAKRVSSELGLPVDTPRAIGEGAIGQGGFCGGMRRLCEFDFQFTSGRW